VASSATAAAPPAASKSAARPWAAGYVAAPADDNAGDGVLSPLAQRNGSATVRSESRVQFAKSNGSNGGSGAKSLSGSYFHPNNSSFSILSGSSKMPSHIVAEDLIFRGAKRKPTLGQSIQQFYLSVTHLHFGNLGIVGDVEPLKLCANLRVLYVYENRLTSLKGLGSLPRLTHLYAQENRIESLEDFEAPPSLTQLHLGSNRLSSIRGLDGCTCLAELHLENQKPPHASPGSAALPVLVPLPKPVAEEEEAEEAEEEGGAAAEAAHGAAEAAAGAAAAEGEAYGEDDGGPPPLTIEHSSLMAIAPSLLKLNVSQCAVDDDALEPLIVLQRLQVLDARSNQLESMARLQQFTVRLPELRTLRLQGNPLAADPKFRERIIVFTHRVDDLDGKPIKPTERAFLLERAKRQASAGTRRTSPAAAVARVTSAPPQPPQQLGVSIPSAQSYNLGRGHGLVGTTPGGFFEVNGAGQSASLPSGTRRPWARSPHAV